MTFSTIVCNDAAHHLRMDDAPLSMTITSSGYSKKLLRRACWALGFVSFLVLSMLMAGCSSDASERRLREVIAELQHSLQAGDAAVVQLHVSTDFTGAAGMDRSQLVNLIETQSSRYDTIDVMVSPLSIELEDIQARVRFTATTRGREAEDSIRGNVWRVDTRWRLEDGEWKLLSAQWRPWF